MNRVHEIVKTAEFKGFCYGFVACFVAIFVIAAATSSAITFTASNAIVLTPVPRYQPCLPVCPCTPHVNTTPVPAVPTVPEKKKKGEIGVLGVMLDCGSGCKCSGKGTEGCNCFSRASVACACGACSCDDGAKGAKKW